MRLKLEGKMFGDMCECAEELHKDYNAYGKEALAPIG